MSFFALGSAGAVALGATAGGVVATGAGALASYAGSKLVNKVASGSSSGSVGSLPYQQIDVNQIIADARTAAAENYKRSLELEATNNPVQAAFRNAATQAAVTASLNPPGGTPYTGTTLGNSLLEESADSILQELRLGGRLPADTQAEVVRAALSTSGRAGVAGSDAARGLVARDIGTTSLALQTARQEKAQRAAALLEQLGLGRAQFDLAREQAGAQSTFQFKTLADAFPLPEAGLSPGDIASLSIGDTSATNQVRQNQFLIDQQNANRRAEQINQLLGFGAQAVGGMFASKKPASTTGTVVQT